MSERDVNIRNTSRRLAIPVALFLIVVLGAALRFRGLTIQSLWTDELIAWERGSYDSPGQVIDMGVRPSVHPPGYLMLLHFSMRAFGDSEAALRLPSVIFGILSVLAIYLLGVYIYSPKEGVLAAALMATSWAPLTYSQEARPYSLLLLLSILSSLAWFGMARDVKLHNRLRWSTIALYVLVASATCYVHYFGLLLVFFQGLYSTIAFARLRKAFICVGLAYLAVLALYAPWLPDLFADIGHASSWIPQPTNLALWSYALFLFSNSPLLVLLAAEGIGLLAWSQIRAVKRPVLKTLAQRLLDPTFVLLLWLVVPVLTVLFKSMVSTPIFSLRNLIICLPAAYLLLAHSVFALPGSERISPILVSVGAVLLSMGLAADVILRLDYYSGIHKEQFREAVQYVVDNNTEYPSSVVIGCTWSTQSLEYYFEHFGSPRTVVGPIRTEEDIPSLRKIIQEESPTYIWYVAANIPPTEKLLEFLSAEFNEIDSKEFYGAHVWLYRVPQGEPVSGN